MLGMSEEDRQMLQLAYAAFVADRTAQKPIEYNNWHLLPEEERQRYIAIAQAVVREYQEQAGDREKELKALRQWKKSWMPVVNDWANRH